jgi:hypothetical protein
MEETKMTKEEFAQMECAQQKIWKELAESGEDVKQSAVYIPFQYGCPACTIACHAYDNRIIKHGILSLDKGKCALCPIDLWRDALEFNPSCQGGDDIDGFTGTLETVKKMPLYGQWMVLSGHCDSDINDSEYEIIEARKKVALEISKLEFSWLEEYEAVELEQVTKDYLKGEEEYGC